MLSIYLISSLSLSGAPQSPALVMFSPQAHVVCAMSCLFACAPLFLCVCVCVCVCACACVCVSVLEYSTVIQGNPHIVVGGVNTECVY